MKSALSHILLVLLLSSGAALFAQNRAVSLHLSSMDNSGEGDIITKTIMVPEGFTPTYTYYSAMGWWGTGGEGDGYCGIQQHPDGRNFIFSIWDPESTDEAIVASYLGHGTKSENFGGEGTGLKSWNFSLGWNTDTWYRMVTRLWPYEGHTFFGYWVQDMGSGEWYHLVTMDYPVPGVKINSNINSFLEDWYGNGWEIRRYYIKEGFKRNMDQSWDSFERARFSVNQEKPTENYNDNYDGGVLGDSCYYVQSGGDTEATCATTAVFYMTQDPLPKWDTISLEQVYAVYDAVEKELNLGWEINPAAGPQFSFHGAIYDNPDGTGVPVLSFADTIPQLKEISLDLSGMADGTYYLQFQVADIFDGQSQVLSREILIDTEVKVPTASFETENSTVSQYSFVQFMENSGGIPSAWEWSFNGGVPDSSLERHPVISYNTPGSYNVKLVASNGMGSDTLLMEDYITVEATGDNALDLGGVMGDYVNIPALDLEAAEFTFECWMKIEGDQQSYAGIFFNREDKGTGLNFRENNELGYHWKDRAYNWSSGLHVPFDKWCHVAWVVSADKVAIYLDGVPAFNESTQDPVVFSGMSTLGADYAFGRNFDGLMDEVRIWNRARSADEILDYRYMDLDYENEVGLLAYYKCDQLNTLGLYDVIGLRHAEFEAMESDSWLPSFAKTNLPVVPVANFAVSHTEAEVNTDINFYDASAFVPTEWHWYLEGATPSESLQRFPVVSYASPGVYIARLICTNTEGSDTLLREGLVTIVNPPAPVAVFGASKVVIHQGESITMNNQSKNDPTDYSWYFEGGTPESSSEEEPVVQYSEPGTFNISLIASNVYGADTLELVDYIKVNYPLGIGKPESGMSLQVLGDHLLIERAFSGEADVVISTMSGREVYQGRLEQGSNLIRLQEGAGIYILTIHCNTEVINRKFYLSK